MTYKVVTGTHTANLDQKVNRALKTGWVLQGGASYSYGVWAQAMIKEEE